MKRLLTFLLLLSATANYSYSQALHIDSTRFITGNICCTQIEYAIPTADGGIFFCGSSSNNAGGIIPILPIDPILYNVLVGKLDKNHQIEWLRSYGGSKEDLGTSAVQMADGGYAVLAQSYSTDGDVSAHKGGPDMWVLRLDGSGNMMWEKSYGSTESDLPISISCTPDGGFIMLGSTNGSDGDVPFHYGGFFELDWLVIKTDGVGNVEWSKNLGSTADEYSRGAILTVDDGYYLVGATYGRDNDCTDTAWASGVLTDYDVYLLKIDAVGNLLWGISYGGSKVDMAFDAFYDTRDSTIMIAGISNSPDYMVTTNYGGNDMWIIKTDKKGSLLWQKSIGTANTEVCTGICAGRDNTYAVYGSTNPGNIGNSDGWVVLLNGEGTIITDKKFGGIMRELPKSIVPFSGGYAITGLSASTVFTDGITYGRNADYTNGFISFMDYWPVSVNDVSSTADEMVLIPNPTSGKVKIMVPENSGNGNLRVINSLGKRIYSTRHKDNNYKEISTDSWPAGIYMVQWQGENGMVYSATLVKK